MLDILGWCLLGLLAIAFVRYWVLGVGERSSGGTVPAAAAKPVTRAETFTWPGSGDFDVEAVGESSYQSALAAAAAVERGGALVADLIPEDGNPHDPKAVRVDILGRTVGYLPREDARTFRRRLGARRLSGQVTQCAATVTGGGEARGGRSLYFGVRLDMKPFDE